MDEKQKLQFQTIVIATLVVLNVGLLIVLGLFWYENRTTSSNKTVTTVTNSATNTTTTNTTTTNTTNSTATTKKTSSEVLSIDDKTQKYVNYDYGFSVTFPKQAKDQVACSSDQKVLDSAVTNLKVLEDASNKILYIADEKVELGRNKKSSDGSIMYDKSSCQIVDNTLASIKKQLMIDANPDSTDLRVFAGGVVGIQYQTGIADADLLALFRSVNGGGTIFSGCTTVKKTKSSDGKTYTVTVGDKNGEVNDACFADFIYQLMYSPTSNTAVATSGTQAPYFEGTNGQTDPKIELLNQ